MTQQGPRNHVCPHGANPLACITCYNITQKQKKNQPPPPRTSLDPQITKGKVVNTATDVSAQNLAARKAAAIDAAMAKVAGKPQLAAAQAAPLPSMHQPPPQQPPSRHQQQQVQNPHAQPRRSRNAPAVDGPPQDMGDNAGVYLDDGEMSMLEDMYPKHASIIDRQPTHPDGHVGSRGTISPGHGGGGSRPPITKGRRPG